MDGGIGQQVSVVAKSQSESNARVESATKEINQRGGVTKFFIGPKYGEIQEVKNEIAANQARINALKQALEQVQGEDVKQALQDQIQTLERETADLQAFVNEAESGFSLLGWLVRLFV
jgi:chromosome segregation ATPase